MTRFEGQVAIVTGGVSGIGAAITRRLVEEGGKIFVADINADAIAAASATFGPNVEGLRTDVTSEPEMEALVAAAVSRFGTLDAIFNVAGGSKPGKLVESDLASWNFNIALNLTSAFLGTKLAAKQFIAEGKPGAIVNIASMNAEVPSHFGGAYSSAKAGVLMLTRTAALELADHGIRTNAVSPGLVATPLTGGLMSMPGVMDAFLERIPARRAAKPEEIASAALFLASSDASYINGENIHVDGAWTTTVYPDLRPFFAKA